MIVVSEVFGPTLQGEGPTAGQRCAFVRLGLCNLQCAWCDTPYTWDWSGVNGRKFDKATLTKSTTAEVVETVTGFGVDRIVISGGEPLVQSRAHMDLVVALDAQGCTVETETNGTLLPHDEFPADVLDRARWNVSPKLSHAGNGMTFETRIRPNVLAWFADRRDQTAFKFVVDSPADIEEILHVVDVAGVVDRGQVWLMPQGVTLEQLAQRTPFVFDTAISHGFNACTRSHVLAWGNQRGH